MLCSIVLMSYPIEVMSSCTSIATTLQSSIMNHNPINFWSSFIFSTSKQNTFVYAIVNKSRKNTCISPTNKSLRLKPQMDISHPLLPHSISLPLMCESCIIHHPQPFQPIPHNWDLIDRSIHFSNPLPPIYEPFFSCWCNSHHRVHRMPFQLCNVPFNKLEHELIVCDNCRSINLPI